MEFTSYFKLLTAFLPTNVDCDGHIFITVLIILMDRKVEEEIYLKSESPLEFALLLLIEGR